MMVAAVVAPGEQTLADREAPAVVVAELEAQPLPLAVQLRVRVPETRAAPVSARMAVVAVERVLLERLGQVESRAMAAQVFLRRSRVPR